MELIRLDDRLRLNIPEIDSQHEKLIELVNGLHEALVGGADKAARDSLLSQLLEGMRNHCAFEEELMVRYGYSGVSGAQVRTRPTYAKPGGSD